MTSARTFVSLILAAAAGLALLAGAAAWWARPAARSTAPATELLRPGTPTEVRAAVRAAAGRVTVVNFWASWCEPCRREFPSYLRLARELRDRGVRLILVSVDDAADFADAERFLKDEGVDFPTFYKGTQSLNFVTEIYPKWTGAIPATVLLGSEAELVDAWEGDTTWAELEKRVKKRIDAP